MQLDPLRTELSPILPLSDFPKMVRSIPSTHQTPDLKIRYLDPRILLKLLQNKKCQIKLEGCLA